MHIAFVRKSVLRTFLQELDWLRSRSRLDETGIKLHGACVGTRCGVRHPVPIDPDDRVSSMYRYRLTIVEFIVCDHNLDGSRVRQTHRMSVSVLCCSNCHTRSSNKCGRYLNPHIRCPHAFPL